MGPGKKTIGSGNEGAFSTYLIWTRVREGGAEKIEGGGNETWLPFERKKRGLVRARKARGGIVTVSKATGCRGHELGRKIGAEHMKECEKV